MRVEHIGDATLYLGLSKYQRYRLRKKGIPVPFAPPRSGFKQTPEHVAKRTRSGEEHYAWQGDAVSEKGGRKRALRAFPAIGPCACGEPKAERHHKDGNTANNDPSNIDILCRRCHMEADGRMTKAKQWRKK